MNKAENQPKDLSLSLLWTLRVPITAITADNSEAIIDWLKDRSAVLIWFTSIITGSLMLLTLFGKKPGFNDPSGVALALSLACMFFAILCNLICVWQIPKWKLAVRTGLISNPRWMIWDIEMTSWLGLVSFLGALVMAGLGNSA